MLRRLQTVSMKLWVILSLVLFVALLSWFSSSGDKLPATLMLYVVEPLLAVSIALISYWVIGSGHIRIRKPGEKVFLILAIVCVWFVIYFLSGLILTYVRNSLVVSFNQTLINILVYGVTAASLEYTRYKILGSTRRQNIIWFGAVVSIVFAMTQIPYGQLYSASTLEDLIKIVVSSIVPAFAASFLLTYLAYTSGLAAMLMFRMSVVLIAIVPPIIPNFDWYLIGISSLLLVLTTYILIDKQIQHTVTHRHKQLHHIQRASDLVFIVFICGLAAFMSGFFSYKPLAILSNSMQPVYSRGSLVVIERVSDSMDIEVGDIVQYESAGKTITHRVVAIDSASDGSGNRVFKTKGDNSPSEDPVVSSSQIGGVVKAYIPFVGYPTIWLREAVL